VINEKKIDGKDALIWAKDNHVELIPIIIEMAKANIEINEKNALVLAKDNKLIQDFHIRMVKEDIKIDNENVLFAAQKQEIDITPTLTKMLEKNCKILGNDSLVWVIDNNIPIKDFLQSYKNKEKLITDLIKMAQEDKKIDGKDIISHLISSHRNY
jgi:hypothetical protein